MNLGSLSRRFRLTVHYFVNLVTAQRCDRAPVRCHSSCILASFFSVSDVAVLSRMRFSWKKTLQALLFALDRRGLEKCSWDTAERLNTTSISRQATAGWMQRYICRRASFRSHLSSKYTSVGAGEQRATRSQYQLPG